ncbi:thioredoxin [Georgenia halophila]|uniref:Thioredoxin n=1 Tax=Georgenia halophila TaxID=620889 RepID=A0ABP8KTY0_9MICO
MSARSVDESTFDQEVLQNDRPVLVDFWADWCGPCKSLSPILDQLAADHPGTLDVVKVNVEENTGLAASYMVTALPAMKVFQGGEVVHEIRGAKPKRALEAELAPYLGA